MIFACFPALDTLPQMGGGGSFGGDGGGGGGGGDSEFLWVLLRMWIHLLIHYPALGVPLTIVVLIVVFVGFREGWWKKQERTIRRSRPDRRAHASAVSADALREHDPAFDGRRFLERVGTAFDTGQASWCAQDLEPMRPFVTDGVFERLSLQVEEQRADGWRQGMDDVRRETLSIAHVELGDPFETITVRVPFHAEIDRRRLDDGGRIRGSRLPRDRFAEHWSFVRRRGTKTLDGDGLIEGCCPDCGASLRMVQSARCEYCGCLARSGQFDWVLAEITQSSEWRVEPEGSIPGFVPYRERDPGANVQMLEDRASVAFWRLRAAERAGRSDALTSVATAAFCEEFTKRLARGSTRFAESAVGSVRTLGLLAGAELDRAVIEIKWDGVPESDDASGPRRLERTRRLHQTLFVFERVAGQVTPLDEAFTTAHCASCGAHDPGGTSPVCAFCEAPRRGGPATWLLTDVAERGSRTGRELASALASADDPGVRETRVTETPEGLVAWAARLATADGNLSRRELDALEGLARRAEVSSERLAFYLQEDEPTAAILDAPRDRDTARRWLEELIEIGMSSGVLTRRERRILVRIGAMLSFEKREVEDVVRDVRARLYRASRAAKHSVE